MSNNRLILNLDEFRAELRNLPVELRDEGGGYVRSAAEETADEVRSAYPEVTGNLKRGVKVKHQTSTVGSVSIVSSTAAHAHLYEYGTATRHTALGANRGAMPVRPTFVPSAQRNRREMYEQLIDLLTRQGLQVTGSASG